MLVVLYPQKWLPYRYLWPFLRNHLDSVGALSRLAKQTPISRHPEILILEAGRDELVPAEHGDRLLAHCHTVGLPAQRKAIDTAYHTDVMVLQAGRSAVVEAIREAVKKL